MEGALIRLTSADGARILIEALRALDGAGLSPASLTVREPSMDDVFLNLTGKHAESDEADGDGGSAYGQREEGMSVRSVEQRDTPIEHHGLGRFSAGVADMLALAQRNLIALVRVPQLLVFSTIQPIIFVLLFRYVFGGAVQGSLPPGVPYVEYLMPGVFVQTATFGALGSAIGLATDVKSGLLERFRSLPMARSAVLTGQDAGRPGAQRRSSRSSC